MAELESATEKSRLLPESDPRTDRHHPANKNVILVLAIGGLLLGAVRSFPGREPAPLDLVVHYTSSGTLSMMKRTHLSINSIAEG